MANYKVVDADVLDAGLTRVADKVRAKAGTSEMLVFPDGYESALDSIESADSALAEVESILSKGYTDYSYYFYNNQQMTEVPAGILRHTSNGTDFESMFQNCAYITEVPSFDLSNAKYLNSCFNSCSGLTEVGVLNTSKALQMNSFFAACKKLVTVQGINISSLENDTSGYGNIFRYCSGLTNLTINGAINITYLDLSPCTKLTHNSLMSVINALKDHASAGTSGTLMLGSTNKAKLTEDELHIALSKGWTVS